MSCTNPSIDTVFANISENWIQLDTNIIQYLFQVYDNDPGIRATSSIKLDAILSGDILIQGTGVYKLNEFALQSNIWKQWCNGLYRSKQ